MLSSKPDIKICWAQPQKRLLDEPLFAAFQRTPTMPYPWPSGRLCSDVGPVGFAVPCSSSEIMTKHFHMMHSLSVMWAIHTSHLFYAADTLGFCFCDSTHWGRITEALCLLCLGRERVGAGGRGGDWQGEVYWKISHDKLALALGERDRFTLSPSVVIFRASTEPRELKTTWCA